MTSATAIQEDDAGSTIRLRMVVKPANPSHAYLKPLNEAQRRAFMQMAMDFTAVALASKDVELAISELPALAPAKRARSTKRGEVKPIAKSPQPKPSNTPKPSSVPKGTRAALENF